MRHSNAPRGFFSVCIIIMYFTYYPKYVQSVEIECLPLKSCPTALKFASTAKYAPETYDFFKVSFCGYDERNQPKVWCTKLNFCVTPQNRNGTCTPVEKCKSFLKLRSTVDISDPIIENFLQKFHCNEILDEEHVCCQNEETLSKNEDYNNEKPALHDRFFHNDHYSNHFNDDSYDYPNHFDYHDTSYPNHKMGHHPTLRNKHAGWHKEWENRGSVNSRRENTPSTTTQRSFVPDYEDYDGDGYRRDYFPSFPHFDNFDKGNRGDESYNINNNKLTTESYESSTQHTFKRKTTELTRSSKPTTVSYETTSNRDLVLDVGGGDIIFEDSFKEILEGKARRSSEVTPKPNKPKRTNKDESVNSCKTPDSKPGTCISPNDCTHYTNLRNNLDLSKASVRDHLNKFKCGSSDGICCQKDEENTIDNSVLNAERSKDDGPKTAQPPSQVCGRQTINTDRIVGGSVAELGEFPWLALLQYPSGAGIQQACGGTLVNSRYVVTAAHCVDERILRARGLGQVRQVVLGEYDTRNKTDCIYMRQGTDCADPPKTYTVESVIPHNLYSSDTAVHDIALLRLHQDVSFTDYIIPICLPTKTSTLRGNETFVIAGWGRTSTVLQTTSPVIRKAKIPYVERAKCNRRRRTLIEGQMCAGLGDGIDHCNGDSGGPVMLEVNFNFEFVTYLVGVISYGFFECGKGPSVNTYVPYYIDWINQNMKP